MKKNLLVVLLSLAVASTVSLASNDVPLRNWTVAERAWAPAGADESVSALSVPTPALSFTGITPCRLADTRVGFGFVNPFGPPALVAGATRTFPVTGQCGIPSTAQAVSFNFTVTGTAGPGDLRAWPAGPAPPQVSTLNYLGGQTLANAAIVPLGTGGSVSVLPAVSGTDLIIDVNGYFAPEAVSASRTIWVGPVGSPTQNGTALLAALAGISGASPSNGYLLKVEPGVYDVGATPLAMKSSVDIEGSGELVTVIAKQTCDQGAVQGADAAEIRSLTVQCLGVTLNAMGIYCNGTSPKITHVTAMATSGSVASAFGIYLRNSSAVLTNVTTVVNGNGFYNEGIAMDSTGPPVPNATIDGLVATIKGTPASVLAGIDIGAQPAGVQVRNATITLYGSASTPNCHGIRNAGYLAVQNSTIFSTGCPTAYGINNGSGSAANLSGVHVSASGTTNAYGIWTTGAVLSLYNSEIQASGGATFDDALHLAGGSNFTVVGSTLTAVSGTGASVSTGDSDGSVTGSLLLSSRAGAGNHWGVYTEDSAAAQVVVVASSRIISTDYTVKNKANTTLRIANSTMEGPLGTQNTGTLKCAGVVDANGTFFASSCP